MIQIYPNDPVTSSLHQSRSGDITCCESAKKTLKLRVELFPSCFFLFAIRLFFDLRLFLFLRKPTVQHSCSAIAEASAGGVSSVPGDKSIPNDGSDGVSNLGQNKKIKSSLMDCDPKMKPIIRYPIFVVMLCIFVEQKSKKSSDIPIHLQTKIHLFSAKKLKKDWALAAFDASSCKQQATRLIGRWKYGWSPTSTDSIRVGASVGFLCKFSEVSAYLRQKVSRV